MKPMIKYRGGKTNEIPRIMGHIPRFTGRYVLSHSLAVEHYSFILSPDKLLSMI